MVFHWKTWFYIERHDFNWKTWSYIETDGLTLKDMILHWNRWSYTERHDLAVRDITLILPWNIWSCIERHNHALKNMILHWKTWSYTERHILYWKAWSYIETPDLSLKDTLLHIDIFQCWPILVYQCVCMCTLAAKNVTLQWNVMGRTKESCAHPCSLANVLLIRWSSLDG